MAKWDHGTIGKLILEHGAVRLAAAEDIARVLQAVDTRGVARQLEQEDDAVRPVLDRIYDSGRGVQPISLGLSLDFTAAVDELGELLGPALSSAGEVASGLSLASDLGSIVHSCEAPTSSESMLPGIPVRNTGAVDGPSWLGFIRPLTAFVGSPGERARWVIASWRNISIMKHDVDAATTRMSCNDTNESRRSRATPPLEFCWRRIADDPRTVG